MFNLLILLLIIIIIIAGLIYFVNSKIIIHDFIRLSRTRIFFIDNKIIITQNIFINYYNILRIMGLEFSSSDYTIYYKLRNSKNKSILEKGKGITIYPWIRFYIK